MLPRMTKEKIYCGLDIGSQRIKAAMIRARSLDDLELLGVYEMPTAGFKQSSVQDLGEFSECIFRTVTGLTRKIGVNLQTVQLGVGGDLVASRRSHTVIPLVDRGSKVIVNNDVKRINRQAQLLGIKMEEEVLHDFPQYYKVDDVNTALNPIGLYGRKLEVGLLLILSEISRMNNIIKAVNQAGFEAANLFFNSFAAASVTLNAKMKNEGCVFVDLGAASSNVLIFKDGLLKHLARLSWGGERLTRSIAKTLNLSFDLAEDIKKSYATVLNADDGPDEEILVKKEDGYMPVKKNLIFEAIDPEIQGLITELTGIIQKSGVGDQLNAGIIMVGGTSLLTGLIERIESGTHFPVSMGKISVSGRTIGSAALFASAIGLASEGFSEEYKRKILSNGRGTRVRGLVDKIKDLYQEYF
jgi:cell division protein FtsA